MNDQLLRAVIAIAAGALAGGLTNTVAIWMLFHPYQPPRLGRWRIRMLHGAVPRNQERLAGAIGRAVGNRLLTEEDLLRVLGESEFREAFDEGLGRFLHDLLEIERGSLTELLGPEVMERAAPVIDEAVEHALARIDRHLHSEAFAGAVEARAARLRDIVSDHPVSDLLTPSREERIVEAAEQWLEGAVASDRFHQAVTEYLQRAADRFLSPSLTIRELLPEGAIGVLERAIADFVPLAIRRMGGVLEDPGTRERVERAIQDVLGRFLQDLRFHQRVVARVVLSGDAVKRALDTIRVEGAERIAELFQEQTVEEAMARGIRGAIEDLLDRPVPDVLGSPGDPSVGEAIDTASLWLAGAARDPSFRDFLRERAQSALRRTAERRWGDVIGELPPERVAGWVVAAARSEVARTLLRELVGRLAAGIVERPIGRPARWLPGNAPESIRMAIGEPLWRWVQGQIPAVVARVDVARRVEDKVRDFPVDRMEEMVRRVTERELRTIVRLGYVLGAFVGVVLVTVNALLG